MLTRGVICVQIKVSLSSFIRPVMLFVISEISEIASEVQRLEGYISGTQV